MIEFKPFPKIARLNREIVVTEKLDGTNALIHFEDDGTMYVGSRTRWITPADDNYGFARWAEGNKSELEKLGPGSHFGEWWGGGIQRGYGLKEKRFSLFNTSKWGDGAVRPACCHVVPVLYQGAMREDAISAALNDLRTNGSVAVPGFMKPEGIVIFHTAAGIMMKVTCEKDESPKGEVR